MLGLARTAFVVVLLAAAGIERVLLEEERLLEHH